MIRGIDRDLIVRESQEIRTGIRIIEVGMRGYGSQLD